MQNGSNSANVYSVILVRLLATVCVILAGCAGPVLLKEAPPIASSKPLAEGKDERVLASIETVILRNGPDAWARDGEWDEYVIRISSLSDETVEIREIAIFDALDYRIEPRSDRSDLVDGSREIERRQTPLPVSLPRDAEASVALFFPLTPLSERAQVVYADGHGEHRLDIDTRQAIIDLNPPTTLVTRQDPNFPDHARRAGIDRGYVTAQLTLDRQGRVQDVVVIESVPRSVFDEQARRTFHGWAYNKSRFDSRTVEARHEFKR